MCKFSFQALLNHFTCKIIIFNVKSYKKHDLFTNIENIDKLDLFFYKAIIYNFDDYNSSIFSSNSTIKNGSNLSAFLNNPTTTFFILEKEADLDLICIVKFYT